MARSPSQMMMMMEGAGGRYGCGERSRPGSDMMLPTAAHTRLFHQVHHTQYMGNEVILSQLSLSANVHWT